MIAAQQYFIEFCADLNMERLLNLLPNYIPDYCLTNAEKSIDRWAALIVQAYKKVNFVILCIHSIKSSCKYQNEC